MIFSISLKQRVTGAFVIIGFIACVAGKYYYEINDHQKILDSVKSIRQSQESLTKEMLRIRTGIVSSYDSLVETENTLRQESNSLKTY